MKYGPAIIEALICAAFTYLIYTCGIDEYPWRSTLIGALFVGGMVSGFFSTMESKKSIIYIGILIIGLYILIYMWQDPLFIIGAIFLFICHSAFYVGWKLGLRNQQV